MKKLTSLIVFAFLLSNGIFSQNPAWILPPNYLNGLAQPLPTPGLPNYDGHVAACASNMQLDASGNILFFVVDGKYLVYLDLNNEINQKGGCFILDESKISIVQIIN